MTELFAAALYLMAVAVLRGGLPAAVLWVLKKNPLFVLMRVYRAALLEGRAPLWKLWLLALVVFVVGHAWFAKLKRSFADVI